MRSLLLTLSILLAGSYTLQAQESLSGHLNTGLVVPFNDFTNNDFRGVKPNLLISAGLGYALSVPNLRLRGDVTAAILNGSNNSSFYETTFYEGLVSLQYNLVPLFNESSDFRFYLTGGAGVTAYYAKLYDIRTRTLRGESPIPSESSFSLNPVVAAGFEMGYAVTPNLEINLGFTERLMLFNDFMDAFESGSSDDLYGNATVGLTFYLKKQKDKSKVELDKNKYNQLISTIDSLEQANNRVDTEKVARLEMESQEKELKIQMLQNKLDSMRAKVVKIDTDQPATQPKPDAQALLAESKYRIIVASLPSRTMAQRWIDRSSLDKSEMFIVYVDDLNTYRVVYKSFDTFQAARKEQGQVKSIVADAWIKKF